MDLLAGASEPRSSRTTSPGAQLTSVEKNMSVLRKNGILASTGKGRANRVYNILRPELLQAVAHGHALEAD
ncbi:hypothetical protein [Streptomyces sp. CB02261]|uniref:hypothetical protein n=1 Tax=Streptomyces sp. CB02261 TaxID=1703940 RepID=UPI00093A0260|nr:hypothetical protein [Streptomyces sp. CB02261]OKJ52720.1 hypothetical protein AMK29_31485 [Streptomyces sp. CB02261]